MTTGIQSGIELIRLPSGKYRLIVNGKVVANEVDIPEVEARIAQYEEGGESLG